MPGIKQPLLDILSILAGLDVTNGDGATVKLAPRVWNNQIRYDKEGKLYAYVKPACFVEIVSPAAFQILGQGIRSCDILLRFHLSTEDYNTEGTFDQDLKIFDFRDKITGWISERRLTNCGPLEIISENQDYEHDNVYHYILEAVCNFTDTSGSRLDNNRWDHYILSTPPTALQINKTEHKNGGQPVDTGYVIRGRDKKY